MAATPAILSRNFGNPGKAFSLYLAHLVDG
jgi:hypothetical protein